VAHGPPRLPLVLCPTSRDTAQSLKRILRLPERFLGGTRYHRTAPHPRVLPLHPSVQREALASILEGSLRDTGGGYAADRWNHPRNRRPILRPSERF